MKFSLRTLLIVITILPPLLGGLYYSAFLAPDRSLLISNSPDGSSCGIGPWTDPKTGLAGYWHWEQGCDCQSGNSIRDYHNGGNYTCLKCGKRWRAYRYDTPDEWELASNFGYDEQHRHIEKPDARPDR